MHLSNPLQFHFFSLCLAPSQLASETKQRNKANSGVRVTGYEPSEWSGRPCEAVGNFTVGYDEAKVSNEQLVQSLWSDAGDIVGVNEGQRTLLKRRLGDECENEARSNQQPSP